jgi:hypothetical protein
LTGIFVPASGYGRHRDRTAIAFQATSGPPTDAAGQPAVLAQVYVLGASAVLPAAVLVAHSATSPEWRAATGCVETFGKRSSAMIAFEFSEECLGFLVGQVELHVSALCHDAMRLSTSRDVRNNQGLCQKDRQQASEHPRGGFEGHVDYRPRWPEISILWPGLSRQQDGSRPIFWWLRGAHPESKPDLRR